MRLLAIQTKSSQQMFQVPIRLYAGDSHLLYSSRCAIHLCFTQIQAIFVRLSFLEFNYKRDKTAESGNRIVYLIDVHFEDSLIIGDMPLPHHIPLILQKV